MWRRRAVAEPWMHVAATEEQALRNEWVKQEDQEIERG